MNDSIITLLPELIVDKKAISKDYKTVKERFSGILKGRVPPNGFVNVFEQSIDNVKDLPGIAKVINQITPSLHRGAWFIRTIAGKISPCHVDGRPVGINVVIQDGGNSTIRFHQQPGDFTNAMVIEGITPPVLFETTVKQPFIFKATTPHSTNNPDKKDRITLTISFDAETTYEEIIKLHKDGKLLV